PPDAPRRPGALPADAGGRQARRYRSAVRADVTTGRPRHRGDETMHDLKAELLRGLWYVALVGADVRPGRLVHKTLLGEPLLIGRGRDGGAFALRDICAHRGMPLHYGRFDGETTPCCSHRLP